MSLLSVTVKKARYVGIQASQFNTYVTLKLQNVKSTTVTVKGPTPCWEQDFLFEINDINLGLLIEVWNKGVIWDRALGYHYLPLTTVAYNEQEIGGRWIELEAQLMMRGSEVVGTAGPTGHALLLDCRFEPPFDAEGGGDLQRKLDLLNGALDAERAEQARRQMQYIAHSGYSEDSDYTSDLNYPVGQHANCSASQFRTAAHQMHTPQRSLEVSRENSYERDEYHMHSDADPLYYNSQPRPNRIDTWSQLHAQASVESQISWRTADVWHSAEDQRRPSLERQSTLYDEGVAYAYDTYTNLTHLRDHAHLSHQPSYEEYYDSSSYNYNSFISDTRQWDPNRFLYEDDYGLTSTEYENFINKRRSSNVQLPNMPQKQYGQSSRYSDFNGMAPYRPRARRTAASLPATPSSTPKRGRALPIPPGSESGSVRSGRGRRLPLAPAGQHTAHIVPYVPEPAKSLADLSYGYKSYGYSKYNDTEQYQDNNYNTSYDEDGMQPFFDETPHATPPAAAPKPSWNESETIAQFTYPVANEDESVHKTIPALKSYLPEMIESYQYDQYDNQKYQELDQLDQVYVEPKVQNYGVHYESQFEQQYQEEQKKLHQDNYFSQQDTQYQLNQNQSQLDQQNQYQLQQKQLLQQQNQLLQNQNQLQQQQKLQQQQQQQKVTPQQLQSSVMTGAATLGSFMAGGAKKLGSFFGAAAAAVSAPAVQPTQPSVSYAPAAPVTMTAPILPYTSSVPEATSEVLSTVTTSAPVTIPRTPSLRRQDTIQRPPVRRTRTLPDAPDDMSASFDDSAYEDEYDKTEYDHATDRDKASLDRYHEEEYIHETIPEDEEDQHISEEHSPIHKTASPTRNGSHMRKPSVESYHSQTPSVIDRRTSQDKLGLPTIPTTLEETTTEKSKVTFQDDRTTFQEEHEDTAFHEAENYEETEYQEEDGYNEQEEKFQKQGEFQEAEEQYQEEEIFTEEPPRPKPKTEQPKLTPRQLWHRAYNKIVMQLNVSLSYLSNEADKRIFGD